MNIEKELALTRGQELLPMPYGRPSVLNGNRDFTAWGDKLEQHKDKALELLAPIYGDDAEAVYRLALAEHLYQRDECFEALVQVVSTISNDGKKEGCAVSVCGTHVGNDYSGNQWAGILYDAAYEGAAGKSSCGRPDQ